MVIEDNKMTDKKLYEALKGIYKSEILAGKGGFWIKDRGFITLQQARKITGIRGKKRMRRDAVRPWGDYATIAIINGVKTK